VSSKQHDKELARAKRQASAAQARQRRTRILATVLVAALAVTLFGAAIASVVSGDPGAGEPAGHVGESEADVEGGATEAALEPGYANPQGAEAEPCPTDVDAPEPAAEPLESAPDQVIEPSGTYTATLATTCGDIVVELDADAAPVTVNNFVALAAEDYYVGVPFHRVINGFMIQGGDPTGTGHGGEGRFPGYTFEDELGLAQSLVAEHGGYPRGTLAMANAGPDTNGSQFFVVQAEPGFPLSPDFSVFGRVLEGMDVVDRIAQGPVEGDRAVDPVRITDVTVEGGPGR
jgi:cyclophilin family peptidyl-prolyl cis-trans isomerase